MGYHYWRTLLNSGNEIKDQGQICLTIGENTQLCETFVYNSVPYEVDLTFRTLTEEISRLHVSFQYGCRSGL